MMYDRVAVQVAKPPTWQWKSTVLGSLAAGGQVLRLYFVLPPECVHVFASFARKDLDEQVERGNTDLRASSFTASQFLQMLGFSSPEGERNGSAGGNAEHQRATANALPVSREGAEQSGKAQKEAVKKG
ncbi:hypothetical protein [Dictyobacter formicarum]|uniref:Uncharacterized protein n=1 Tax=Dictyobacter formicarum TaxID=2778368 RepID=A0ABQ3VAR4_9CHLR|nr:hypothetical protein [Dictyobacter formicarum]GHO82571.1 hypothetical protein KSZ_05770 [Dictyobacter formicarum]